jgi:surfactin synthase thioesterase subunit
LDTFKGRIQLLNAGDDFDGGDLQTPGSHTEYTRIPQVRQSGQVIPLFFLVLCLEGKGDDFLLDQPFPAVFLGLAMGAALATEATRKGLRRKHA